MVSHALKNEFLFELWHALERAGLQPDPNLIVGQKYVFKCCDNGPVICGTITAMGVSDLMSVPVGLELYVSNPEVYGEKIRCITKTNSGWAVEVCTESERFADRFFIGELRIFFGPMPAPSD